jgi:hypothetical protein
LWRTYWKRIEHEREKRKERRLKWTDIYGGDSDDSGGMTRTLSKCTAWTRSCIGLQRSKIGRL